MVEKKIEEKNTNIIKAQKVVQELQVTLNPDIEISKSMGQLYEYIYHQLMEANFKNDPNLLEEMEGYLVEFRDTWKQAMELVKR